MKALWHDAFISYSHAADSSVAEELERGLEHLAKPLLQLRGALDVFRDQTSLTASPALWSGIVAHLSVSDWFLFLASPASAASVWCSKEVQWWLENRSPDRMLMLLTEGDIVWDSAARDFDWSRTRSLPRLLERRYAEEPLFVDLRWARGVPLLSLRNPKFRDAVVDVAAPIRGIPKDQLDSDDLRQLARNRLLVRSLGTAITIAAVVATWQAIEATRQRHEAERQRDIAIARQLVAQAELLRAQQPDRLPLAALMATQAAQSQPGSLETQQALFAALAPLPRQVAVLPHADSVTAVRFNRAHDHLATAARGGGGMLWNVRDGKPIAPLTGADRTVAYSPDDRLIAGCCRAVNVWNAAGTVVFDVPRAELLGAPRAVVFSGDSRWLAIGVRAQAPFFVVYDLVARKLVFRRDPLSPENVSSSANATAIAFGPGGDLHVALAEEIEVYDPQRWQVVRRLQPKIGNVQRLAFSPDGRFLAASGTAEVVVYDLVHGGERRLEAHNDGPGRIETLQFDATSQYLGAAGLLSTGSIWNVGTWRPVAAVGHGESFDTHALSFDTAGGEAISCASDGNCLGWSLSTGGRTRRFAHVYAYTDGKPESLALLSAAFSSDGTLLVTGGADKTARIWETARPGEVARSRCERREVFVAAFTRSGIAGRCWPALPVDAVFEPATTDDGRFAAATVPFDTVEVWDTTVAGARVRLAHSDPVDWGALEGRLAATVKERVEGATFSRMRFKGSVETLALSPTGRHVVTYRGADQTLRAWDTGSAQVIHRDVIAQQPTVRFLSETTFLRADASGAISVVELPEGTVSWSRDVGRLRAMAVTRDSARIATLGQGPGGVALRVLDAATGSVVLEQAVDPAAGGLFFDPTGNRLTVTSHFGEQLPLTGLPPAIAASVWDVAAQRVVVALPRDAKTIAFDTSRDGKHFVSVGSNGEVRVWDLATGASRSAVTADPGPVAFSADGRWIAVGFRSVRVFETAALRPVAQLDTGGEIYALGFEADDALIASLRAENGARLGLVERRRWKAADLLADACRRMPMDAAQEQWRRLLPEQPVPMPCAQKREAGAAGR